MGVPAPNTDRLLGVPSVNSDKNGLVVLKNGVAAKKPRECTHAKFRADMHVHAFSANAKEAYPVVKLVHIYILAYVLKSELERPLAK